MYALGLPVFASSPRRLAPRAARARGTTPTQAADLAALSRVREFANGPDPAAGSVTVSSVSLLGTGGTGQPRFRIVTSDGRQREVEGIAAVHGFFGSLVRSITKHPGYLLAGIATLGLGVVAIGALSAGGGAAAGAGIAAGAGAAAASTGAGAALAAGAGGAVSVAGAGGLISSAVSGLGSLAGGVAKTALTLTSLGGLGGQAPSQAATDPGLGPILTTVGNVAFASQFGVNPGFNASTTAGQVLQAGFTSTVQQGLVTSFGAPAVGLATGALTPAQAQQLQAQQNLQAQQQQSAQLQAQQQAQVAAQAAANRAAKQAQIQQLYAQYSDQLNQAQSNYQLAATNNQPALAQQWATYYSQIAAYLQQLQAAYAAA